MTPTTSTVITYTREQIGEILAREAARDAGIDDSATWNASITITFGPDGVVSATVRIRTQP